MNYTIIILVYVAWHPLQLMNYFKEPRRAHFLTWRGNFVCLYVIYDAWKAFGFQSINALDLLKQWCDNFVCLFYHFAVNILSSGWFWCLLCLV